MENIKDKAKDLTEDVSEYLETFYKLKVLQVTDKAAGIASVSLSSLLLFVLALFFLLFISIGLSWWLGEMLQNMAAGFCIIAGFYAFLSIILLAFRKNYILPVIRNMIIRKAYE